MLTPTLPWKRRLTGETGTCSECVGPFSRRNGDRPGRQFCGTSCSNRHKGREHAEKIGDALRGRGAGKTYRKRGGRHEHRVVAEQKLGRPLRRGEIVHHENEIKADNAPDNLKVLPSQAEHAREHMKGNTHARRVHAIGQACSECPALAKTRGRCNPHYQRAYRRGEL